MAETGYDPGFLGSAVPLPAVLGDAPRTHLPYRHFSVVLDTTRRLACMTGVNIDGAALVDVPRTGDWDLDPRVPADQQAGPAVYADNDLDRGHLVRRRDPGWGPDAREATEQTFAYPNAAPQASVFNQSKDLWVGLEDHVLQYAQAEALRVSVFTAPVLDDTDPPYRGIRIPRRFFKVAAWADAGTLRSAGFVLDQAALIDAGEPSAVPALGAFRTFQAPVAEIGALAGVDFGDLVAADVAAVDAVRPAPWRELAEAGDIRL